MNINNNKEINIVKIYKNNDIVIAYVKILSKFINAKSGIEKERVESLITQFIVTLFNECRNLDLTYFCQNIKTLQFKLENLNSESTLGEYDSINNIVTIRNFSALQHELFHVASTYKYNNYIYSGFSIENYKNGIKKHNYFNNGYTQLLAKRYFNNQEISYTVPVEIMEQLEKIIGRENLEFFYFKANLNGLIDELKKYQTKENIIKFFNDFELLSHTIEAFSYLSKDINSNALDGILNDIINFLSVCTENKSKIEHSNYNKL